MTHSTLVAQFDILRNSFPKLVKSSCEKSRGDTRVMQEENKILWILWQASSPHRNKQISCEYVPAGCFCALSHAESRESEEGRTHFKPGLCLSNIWLMDSLTDSIPWEQWAIHLCSNGPSCIWSEFMLDFIKLGCQICNLTLLTDDSDNILTLVHSCICMHKCTKHMHTGRCSAVVIYIQCSDKSISEAY